MRRHLALGVLLLLPVWAQDLASFRDWVKASPGYQSLLLQKRQALLGLEAAQGGLGPTLSLQGSYTQTPREALSLGLGGRVGVLPWGSAWDALDQAGRNLRQTELELRAQANALFQRLLAQYLQAHLAQEDLALAEARLRLRQAQLRAVREQEARGQATFQARLEAEAQEAQARLDLAQAQAALALARAQLEAGLGRPLPDPLPPLALAPVPEPDLEGALARLEARREVVLARLQVEALEAELARLRRDRFLPQVNLSLGLSEGVSLKLRPGPEDGVLLLRGPVPPFWV